MEAAEFTSDDEEHAEQTDGVFPLAQEAGVETEGDSDLGGLVEIRLQDGLVEDHNGGHDEDVVGRLTLSLDLVVDILFARAGFRLETLEGERRADVLRGRRRRGDVVCPSKVEVQEFQKGGVGRHNFKDELPSEGFVTETFLEFREDLLVGGILGVQERLKGLIFAAETVEEMAHKDPGAVCVNTFLDTEFHDRKVWLELRARHTIQERGLFDNLRLATIDSWGT